MGPNDHLPLDDQGLGAEYDDETPYCPHCGWVGCEMCEDDDESFDDED